MSTAAVFGFLICSAAGLACACMLKYLFTPIKSLRQAHDEGWYEGVRYQQSLTAPHRDHQGRFSKKPALHDPSRIPPTLPKRF